MIENRRIIFLENHILIYSYINRTTVEIFELCNKFNRIQQVDKTEYPFAL